MNNPHDLRDYFAAKVLQGLLADPEDIECVQGKNCSESVAIYAYRIADEMLKARRDQHDDE